MEFLFKSGFVFLQVSSTTGLLWFLGWVLKVLRDQVFLKVQYLLISPVELTVSLLISLPSEPVQCVALSTTRRPTSEPGSATETIRVTSSAGLLMALLQLRETCQSQPDQSPANHDTVPPLIAVSFVIL